MFDSSVIFAFVVASAVLGLVPGPTVSVIVANALRSGPAAGFASVAGAQAALATMIAVLALGLDVVVAAMGEAFVYVKLVGAAYLVYLGIKLLRSDGRLAADGRSARTWRGCALQTFAVTWSNPKALLFLGAFLPQFVDPAHPAALQILVYGALFMAVLALVDGAYALLAGRAGRLLTRSRVRTAERVAGGFLLVGGLGLALSRR